MKDSREFSMIKTPKCSIASGRSSYPRPIRLVRRRSIQGASPLPCWKIVTPGKQGLKSPVFYRKTSQALRVCPWKIRSERLVKSTRWYMEGMMEASSRILKDIKLSRNLLYLDTSPQKRG